MQVKSLIHRWRLIGLGVVLCLLAAVFSFEAKIAWYSPATANIHISAVKLQPTEAPRLVAQAIVAHAIGSPAYIEYPFPQLDWLAAFALLLAALASLRQTDFDLTRVLASPGFSPFRFSRPPPAQ